MNEIKNCLHVFFLEKPGYSILELTVCNLVANTWHTESERAHSVYNYYKILIFY